MGLIFLLGTLWLLIFVIYYIAHLVKESRHSGKAHLPSWPTAISLAFALALVFPTLYELSDNSHNNSDPSAEARTYLGAIFTCQMSYFAKANTYGADFTVLNWAPAGGTRYAYYVTDDFVTNTKGTEIPYRLDSNWPFTQSPSTSAFGFTAIAVGNIDGDTFFDAWAFNDAKQFTHLLDDHFDEDLTVFMSHPPRPPTDQWQHRNWIETKDSFENHLLWLIPVSYLVSLIMVYVCYSREKRRRGREQGR